MKKDGYLSAEYLNEISKKLKERPSWWLIDNKLVHCTSYELNTIKHINENIE